MRTILDLCVAMDTFAHRTYDAMSTSCHDPDLAEVFTHMAAEEKDHISWWQDLLEAWERGLVPDVVNDTEGLERHMRTLMHEMQTTAPDSFEGVPDDAMLDVAARLEYFLLDPIFGELLDLTEPGGASKHREAYARHLERIVGAIETYYSRSDLASFLARVLRRAWRDNLALAAFATRDPLTGIYNRRGLMTHLEHWLSWAGRYARPLGVVLVDLDDFKALNDTRGHALGDMALNAVAQTLVETVRGSDLVARYGGDEFAVVAPETSEAELATLSERIVAGVSEITIDRWDEKPTTLRVSTGAAVMIDPGLEGTSLDGLLAAADRSLYVAKSAGKDRAGTVAVYGAMTPAME
jgi:diguanylate cyclase (GGDEF)-like protein